MAPRRTKERHWIIHRRYYEGKAERVSALEQRRADDDVARRILQLLANAGISQPELAILVGTTASFICRPEDADYSGHSLSMLRRITMANERWSGHKPLSKTAEEK